MSQHQRMSMLTAWQPIWVLTPSASSCGGQNGKKQTWRRESLSEESESVSPQGALRSAHLAACTRISCCTVTPLALSSHSGQSPHPRTSSMASVCQDQQEPLPQAPY